MADRREMPIWGWGDPEHERDLPASAISRLRERLRLEDPVGSHPLPSEFTLPPARLSEDSISALARAVGEGQVIRSTAERALRSIGKSYPDLCRGRSGRLDAAVDCVVQPRSRDGIRAVLDLAAERSIAVVPFGGGTSVVGGLEPISGVHSSCISLDLSCMTGLVDLDRTSRTGRFLPGTLGPEAERLVSDSGLTVGHFPQSFLHASLGGFAATRSSGQASTGYGRFDANVVGLEVVSPEGLLELGPNPGSAAGPSVRQMLVGSEGTLGVISSVDVQLHETPELVEDRAWVVESFAAGRDLLRSLEQAGCAPSVARLSDEDETSITLSLAGDGSAARALQRWISLRGFGDGCLLITGFEGSRDELPSRVRRSISIIRASGALSLGSAPAAAWRRGRFAGPYLRDALMDRGLFVETLETSAPWSGLERLYRGVGDALHSTLARAGGEPIVMCHVSHLYGTGASLYFTFIGNASGSSTAERIAQWSEVKTAACDAIVASGGTITHHHAVGTDHRDWMAAEVGELGVSALRSLKSAVDPSGIMNPGKLLPGS